MRGALSVENTVLTFKIAAGPRQRSHSRVRIPWDSHPHLTVLDSKLPYSSPPTTRRATVEVFDPSSTRDNFFSLDEDRLCTTASNNSLIFACILCLAMTGAVTCLHSRFLAMAVLFAHLF
jgi:hypothetical protein